MTEAIQPLRQHDLLILFLQLALLLLAARLCGEGMRRIHQPPVIGELLAGILLGPTLLGHYAPAVYGAIFPQDPLHYTLLEGAAWLGLVLLLLLTGLEVDISRLRRIGRPALLLTGVDLAVSFSAGFAAGWLLPAEYLADPGARGLFAAFMATAVAISAMPVIAKILMDLNLVQRNLGILSLSVAVVEDTIGWVILSVLAGLAAQAGFRAHDLALTLALLVAFVTVALIVVPRILRPIFVWVDHHLHGTGADITLVVAFTFLMAAATERIGVHAVFGGFVAGALLRQVPRLRSESLHNVEQFVLSALAPIFFAYAGLQVNLWSVTGWAVPVAILGLSIGAKLVGCYLGGWLGGLRGWERLAVGAALSARGAMGLVVALLGLTLGLLTEEIYAVLVGVSVITSALTPAFLPILVARVPLTEEERRRIEAGELKRVFRKTGAKLLLLTAGGPHSEAAFRVAAPLATHDGATLTVLYVETRKAGPVWLRKFWHWVRGRAGPLTPIQEHLRRLRSLAEELGTTFDWRTARARRVAEAVLSEAARGYDAILMGAPGLPEGLTPVFQHLVFHAPCHVVIVQRGERGERGVGAGERAHRHILVPTDGSFFARTALEFAVNVAEATAGRVTVFPVLPESEPETAIETASPRERIRQALKGALLGPDRKPITAFAEVPVDVRIGRSDRPSEAIVLEALASDYDLIVAGAENKTLARPLFYGQGTEYLLTNAPCDVAIVVPRL